MPAGQWAASWTTYDAIGRTTAQSVPVMTSSGDSGANTSTASSSWTYDFLGRVREETRPDNSGSSFVYSGTREKKFYVANPGGSPQLRSTERYDGAGRLARVIQPSGPTSATNRTGADVTTDYGYDFADRLVSVTMTGTETATPQTRSFAYDGAGFLTEESHPETGAINYTDYDARGHAGKKLPAGGHSIFKHQYTYDDAERLTEVATGSPSWTSGDGEFRMEKKFVFAPENAGTNKKKGKLEHAIRENFRPCPGGACWADHIRVTETYEYDALGRKARRETVIEDFTGSEPALLKSVEQTFNYNALGLLGSANYPTCDDCGVPPAADPARNLSLTYSEGMLQSVGGYVPSLTYGATGMLTSVAHSNGMTDSVTLDSSGRPKSISFGTWSSCGTPPEITNPPGDQSIASGTSATLEVTASGSTLQYQWYDASSVPASPIAGATQRQYVTPALTATKSYFVRVSNACRSVDSATATVTVTCTAPAITTPPQSPTIVAGTSTTLNVTATGTSLSYQWYRGASGDTSQPVGTGSSQFTTPALFATTRYWVRVSGACGAPANSVTAVVTVPLPAPANLLAGKHPNGIRLTWNNAAGAAKYEVWRRWGSSSYSLMANSAQSGWIDSSGIAGRTYVYKIRAVDADGGSASADSNPDLASLIDFMPIAARSTTISASHWQQLHDTLNALRAAKGDSALSWTQILPAGVPAPAPGVRVRRAHVEALRQQFTSVLQALGIPAPSYTNPNLVTEPEIRAIHVTELQERAQ